MGKIIELIRNLFPILQPEWVTCMAKEIPAEVLAAFYEEEMNHRTIGKNSMDVKIKGFRYKLNFKTKKEIFMAKRKVSII